MDTNEHECGGPKTGLLAERVLVTKRECRRPGSAREMINLIRVNSRLFVVKAEFCFMVRWDPYPGGCAHDDTKVPPD